MPERTYAAVGWITTAGVNLLAFAQSENVLNAASGVTIVGGSLIGVYFLFRHKQLEIEKARQANELDAERKRLDIEKERQQFMAESLAGKLEKATTKIEDLTDQLKANEVLIGLKDKENASYKAMLEQLEVRITANEGKKRHDAVDRISGELSVLHISAMEKDAEIAKLRKELDKTKGVVNQNADITAEIAKDAGSQEIKVAHVEDTSSDLPTLKG